VALQHTVRYFLCSNEVNWLADWKQLSSRCS